MVVAGSAADASADANVRFVHAVPGAGSAELVVKGGAQLGSGVGFGQVTPYVGVSAGSHELSLKSGTRSLAVTTVDLTDGKRYTVVAMSQGKKVQLRPYTDGGATDGKARLRLIHAAPELGSPDVRLDGQALAEKAAYTEATPYLTVSPGSHTLAVTKPGNGGGRPIVSKQVPLSAGSASTALLIGTMGEPTRIVVATDQTAAPSRAPRTGLAPLDGARPWGAIVGIAILAGLLGGTLYLLAGRRRTRAG
jgi:Domain of unknown function (DUF4397)